MDSFLISFYSCAETTQAAVVPPCAPSLSQAVLAHEGTQVRRRLDARVGAADFVLPPCSAADQHPVGEGALTEPSQAGGDV